MPQACKATIDHSTHFLSVGRQCISGLFLDVTMAEFFGVEFRSTSWQPFNHDFRMVSQIGQGLLAGVNANSIPNQNERARKMTLQMLERSNHIITIHRAVEMAFVNLARDGQAYSSRQSPPVRTDPAYDRPLAFRRPRGARLIQEGNAKFIEKYNVCTVAASFFLSWANLVLARGALWFHLAPSRAARAVVHSSPIRPRTD